MVRFFPAAGIRSYIDGKPYNRNREGYYWSSSASSEALICSLFFGAGNMYLNSNTRSNSFPVRCVAQGIRNYSCFAVLRLIIQPPLGLV